MKGRKLSLVGNLFMTALNRRATPYLFYSALFTSFVSQTLTSPPKEMFVYVYPDLGPHLVVDPCLCKLPEHSGCCDMPQQPLLPGRLFGVALRREDVRV